MMLIGTVPTNERSISRALSTKPPRRTGEGGSMRIKRSTFIFILFVLFLSPFIIFILSFVSFDTTRHPTVRKHESPSKIQISDQLYQELIRSLAKNAIEAAFIPELNLHIMSVISSGTIIYFTKKGD
jgi:hypothetical protein